jgi:Glucosyltransferase 24
MPQGTYLRGHTKPEADICVVGAAGEAAKGEEADDRVHVFTVASGHMYERLQKIMVLSVLRNTKCGLCRPSDPCRVHVWLHVWQSQDKSSGSLHERRKVSVS